MRKNELYTDYRDFYEYFGTPRLKGSVNRVKRQFGMTG